MNGDFRNAVASMLQPRNRLENRGGKNDKVSRKMWKIMETSAGEIRVGKTKEERSKERSRKETKEERQEKETEKGKDNGSKEGSRRIGDLE